LARAGANQTDQFFRPQMGAAVIVVATGGLLWYLVHPGSFGTTEQILAVGVFCAFVAAGVQGMSGGSALRKLSIADESEASRLRHRVATGQRVAALFFDDHGHLHGSGTLCLTQTAAMYRRCRFEKGGCAWVC